MLRYHSLTNHYNTKELEKFYIPKNTLFCVTEKLHGANISIKYHSTGEVKYFSRNNEITDSNFYNAGAVFEEVINKTKEAIIQFCVEENVNVILFGELFGDNIQNGVDYGTKKRISFFDMYVETSTDLVLLSQEKFFSFAEKFNLTTVPLLKKGLSLEEALDFDSVFDSLEGTKEDNTCEGIVIKPYFEVIYDKFNQSIFYIKKKNEAFKEKCGIKKEKPVLDDKVIFYSSEFDAYINEERVQSVFSKEGKIETIKDLGKYISLVIKDAKETFLKEEYFNEEEFSKAELKSIFNKGDKARNLLLDALN